MDDEEKYDVYIDGALAESDLSKEKAESYGENARLMLGGSDDEIEIDIKKVNSDD